MDNRVFVHFAEGPSAKRTLCGRKVHPNRPVPDAPPCPTCIDRAGQSYHAIRFRPSEPLVFTMPGGGQLVFSSATVVRLREEKQ